MKIFFKKGSEIKTFSDIQNLKELVTVRPTLQEMLKPSGRKKIIPSGNKEHQKW